MRVSVVGESDWTSPVGVVAAPRDPMDTLALDTGAVPSLPQPADLADGRSTPPERRSGSFHDFPGLFASDWHIPDHRLKKYVCVANIQVEGPDGPATLPAAHRVWIAPGELPAGIDMILGDPYLAMNQAVLDYSSMECTLRGPLSFKDRLKFERRGKEPPRRRVVLSGHRFEDAWEQDALSDYESFQRFCATESKAATGDFHVLAIPGATASRPWWRTSSTSSAISGRTRPPWPCPRRRRAQRGPAISCPAWVPPGTRAGRGTPRPTRRYTVATPWPSTSRACQLPAKPRPDRPQSGSSVGTGASFSARRTNFQPGTQIAPCRRTPTSGSPSGTRPPRPLAFRSAG